MRGGQSTTVSVVFSFFPLLPLPPFHVRKLNANNTLSYFPDVLSAALDSGVAVSSIVIFFCLQYPQNGGIGLTTLQTWWGNTVSGNTADALKTPYWKLGKNETFGPAVWS